MFGASRGGVRLHVIEKTCRFVLDGRHRQSGAILGFDGGLSRDELAAVNMIISTIFRCEEIAEDGEAAAEKPN